MFTKNSQISSLRIFSNNCYNNWIGYTNDKFIIIYKYKHNRFSQLEPKYFKIVLTYIFLKHNPENFSAFIKHLNEFDTQSTNFLSFIKEIKMFKILFISQFNKFMEIKKSWGKPQNDQDDVNILFQLYNNNQISFYTLYFIIKFNNLEIPYGYKKILFEYISRIFYMYTFPQDIIEATIYKKKQGA